MLLTALIRKGDAGPVVEHVELPDGPVADVALLPDYPAEEDAPLTWGRLRPVRQHRLDRRRVIVRLTPALTDEVRTGRVRILRYLPSLESVGDDFELPLTAGRGLAHGLRMGQRAERKPETDGFLSRRRGSGPDCCSWNRPVGRS